MFSIGDIFKKSKEESNKPQPPQGEKQQDGEPRGAPQENKVSIASVIKKDSTESMSAEAKNMYEALFLKARQIYRPSLEIKSDFNIEVNSILDKVISFLSADGKDLLKFCLVDYSIPEEYLALHAVNMCLLSIEIGIGLKYERPQLRELGITSLVHDIGLTKFLDIINRPRKLTKEEYRQIKEHTRAGVELLKISSLGLNKNILDTVLHEHERLDGSGYPEGLKAEAINEFARIIALADVYEAVTHYRPHRMGRPPLAAIKEIMDSKELLDCNMIKALIERVGIFPVGLLVRLNTKETAVVVKDNPKLPLRPTVKIVLDAQGKTCEEPKLLDLQENTLIYIEECLKEYVCN